MQREALATARERAASRFPEALIDTMGREHPSIVRAAILRGDFDQGSLVRNALSQEAQGGE